MYVPRFNDFAGFEELPRTNKMPITEAMIPTDAKMSGKRAAVVCEKPAPLGAFATATAERVIAEMIEPT